MKKFIIEVDGGIFYTHDPKNIVLPTTPFVKVLVEYFSPSTNCKRITNSLPKLGLIPPPPPKTAGYHVGRIYGRTWQYPSGFISWGYRGGYFFVSGGKSVIRLSLGKLLLVNLLQVVKRTNTPLVP